MNRIKKVWLLPFWNAVVLGSIVGMHFVYVDQQNNKYYLEPDVLLVMKMFFLVAVIVASLLFIVEIVIHAIAIPGYQKLMHMIMGNIRPLLLLPALDAIVLGLLFHAWELYLAGGLQYLGWIDKVTAVLVAVVFLVELIVQQIVRAATAST
jgi:hypothetical protein